MSKCNNSPAPAPPLRKRQLLGVLVELGARTLEECERATHRLGMIAASIMALRRDVAAVARDLQRVRARLGDPAAVDPDKLH